LDRLSNTGPFAKWPRRVSRRVPEIEIAAMSALYTHLEAAGYRLVNPCHRPRTRRKDGLLAPYRPRHATPIPSRPELKAILGATRQGKDSRELITDAHRGLFALCYYTAARPESEPCRLLHGDVELGHGANWGSVTYRATKTGGDRRVPLHPEAARYLRPLLLPVPMDKDERERWARTPVFRKMPGKLGKGRKRQDVRWDRSSYAKAWANALAAVAKDRQELAGLWLRDLRKIARTYMVGARVHPDVIRKIMGHADRKAEDRYFVPTDEDLRAGLSVLSLDAVWDACQESQSHSYVTTADEESRKSRAS
jgi:integrase